MKATLTKHLSLLVLVIFASYWGISEALYARSKQPGDMKNTADYHRRFGPPVKKRTLYRDGRTYQEFSGHLPHWSLFLAFPSSRPAYVFDEAGQFVEWSTDPADSHEYQKRWRQKPPVPPQEKTPLPILPPKGGA